jgi:hypothetical protein
MDLCLLEILPVPPSSQSTDALLMMELQPLLFVRNVRNIISLKISTIVLRESIPLTNVINITLIKMDVKNVKLILPQPLMV